MSTKILFFLKNNKAHSSAKVTLFVRMIYAVAAACKKAVTVQLFCYKKLVIWDIKSWKNPHKYDKISIDHTDNKGG